MSRQPDARPPTRSTIVAPALGGCTVHHRPLLALALALALFGSALAQPGGGIAVGVATLPAALDPNRNINNAALQMIDSVFETLIRADPGKGFQLVPALAAGWQRVDDLTLDVSLQEGVTWHDGTPFTSADVVFSFERILDPEGPFALARGILITIASVTAVDDLKVRIVTHDPDPNLEARLASPLGTWMIPAAYHEAVGLDPFGTAPVGTGPFMVTEMTRDRIVLEAFAGYRGAPPSVDRVEFRWIPETSGRITALATGEIDIATNIEPDQFGLLERLPGVDVRTESFERGLHMLLYNQSEPVMQDVRLRQALNLAIDRQLLVDALWGGAAEVARSYQLRTYGPLYFDDYPFSEHDPERAAELVQASGYAGEALIFATHPTWYTNGVNAAQAMQEMWREVGINVEIVVTDSWFGAEGAHIYNWSNGPRYAEPSGGLWLIWGEGSGVQNNRWLPSETRERFNQLGNEAIRTFDLDQRATLYREMLDLWERDAPGTVLYSPFESFGVSASIDWTPGLTYHLDFSAGRLSRR